MLSQPGTYILSSSNQVLVVAVLITGLVLYDHWPWLIVCQVNWV